MTSGMTGCITLARFLSISALAILAAGCAESSLVAKVNKESLSYSTELKEGWRLVKMRCSKCHPVDRALREEVTEGGWRFIVDMMISKNGAYVLPEEKSLIVSFLEFYSKSSKGAD